MSTPWKDPLQRLRLDTVRELGAIEPPCEIDPTRDARATDPSQEVRAADPPQEVGAMDPPREVRAMDPP